MSFQMKKNVGSTDKMVRLVLAAVFFSLFFVLQGSARFIGLVGIVPLFTALAGTCPLYSLMGMSTCPVDKK
jgi:Protein of unknown function (DUF2892)